MAYIGKRPNDIFRGLATYDTFTGDGSTTTFDVTNVMPDGGQNDVDVIVDNVRQEPGASKSFTLGNDGNGEYKRVTFNVAPDDGSEIYVINPGRTTSLIQVSDDAIVTSKLGADAVTGAKIADDAINSEHLVDGSVDNVHLANSSITINGTAVSLGGSVTAGTDWQAVVVADGSTQLTAVAGRGYFLDTNAGVIDVKLPTNPSRGDTFIFADYGNNFATNRVVIDTGGKLIDSTVGAEPGGGGFKLETNGQVVELVFVDDTSGYLVKQNSTPSDLSADPYPQYIQATGGTITTSGNFKIHTFTGDGCFVVSGLGNSSGGGSKVSYVVVAGGGSGGGGDNGVRAGGGGAGGYREGKVSTDPFTASPLAATPCSGLTVTATTFPISVGGGGAQPGPATPINSAAGSGNRGSNSVFSTITSTGGGGGNTLSGDGATFGPGGSGGGGGSADPPGERAAGSGNTPPVSPAQGTNGGTGTPYAGSPLASGGGGGGGATAAGGNASSSCGGDGGAGATSSITGSPVARAGGGGGGGQSTQAGAGGSGGGGEGGGSSAPTVNDAGQAGTANTGGGGGGGSSRMNPESTNPNVPGSAGGKGVVIIRYKFQN